MSSPALSFLPAAILAFCLASAATAQQAPAPAEAAARALIESQTQHLPGAVTIELGSFDAANRLAPCPAPVAFLPGNARAWGNFNVGVRCEDPQWTAWIKARVTVVAPYLISARQLTAGQRIELTDLDSREGDITRFADDILTLPAQAVGHHTRYTVARNKPLQARMLRTPAAIQQGKDVTVINRGEGFQVTNIGRALNDAALGELVRVKLSNGLIVSGIARSDGTVELGK